MTMPDVLDASGTERELPVVEGHWLYTPVASAGQSYLVAVIPSFDARFEKAAEGWVVRDVSTGVFGHGETVADAVKDFLHAATEHLDVLERQSALSDGLSAQLKYLRERIRR
jgi:hypothetical protein